MSDYEHALQQSADPAAEGGGGGPRRRRRRGGGGRGEGGGDDDRGPSGSERGGGSSGGGGRGGRGRRSDNYDDAPAREGRLRRVIEGETDFAELENLAEAYGKAWGSKPPWVKNRFSTYQVRTIVGLIEGLKRRPFDEEAQRSFRLLRPQVAYLARRYHDDDLYDFARVVRAAVELVGDDESRFRRFTDLFDSMLFYFRAAGGR